MPPATLISWTAMAVLAGAVPVETQPFRETITDNPLRERVVVQRVHLPVLVQPTRRGRRPPGRCSALTPSDVIVAEDGQSVRVTSVDRTPPGALHAIVIDVSGTMRTRLDRAKEAAVDYLQALPPGELAMVASFDDNLILRAPPTLDREVLARAVRNMEVGFNTALWDALRYVIRYVEPFPGHKVIVLLTDGEDNLSLPSWGREQILELATATPSLTIFSIGLDLPSHSRTGGLPPSVILSRLASETGGTFHEVKRLYRLPRAFERVRRRLEAKHFVTYVPRPPELPDRGSSPVRRRISVRSREGVPCRIVPLGAPYRTEGSADRGAVVMDAPGQSAKVEPCAGRGDEYTVRAELRVPLEGDSGTDPLRFLLVEPPRLLLGEARDLTLERGVLYNREVFRRSGRLRIELDRKPETDSRNFLVEVPTRDFVQRRLGTPEDVAIHLLRRETCDGEGRDRGSWPQAPLWIHGQTFLEIREALGNVLFQHFPSYRRWAAARILESLGSEREAILAELGETGSVSAEEIAVVDRVLRTRAEAPRASQPQRFLAEWLGDVPAGELASGVERRAADALLRRGPDGEGGLARSVLDGWAEMRSWFPPPTRVRILTPLLPAYDAARDVIGFYRILLPRPGLGGPPVDPVPERPFGLLTLMWLTDLDPRMGEILQGDSRLTALEHRTPTRREIRTLAASLRRADPARTFRFASAVRRVDLTVEDPHADGARLELTAWVGSRVGEEPPVCVEVRAETAAGDRLDETAGRLATLLAERGRLCPE